MPYYYVEFYDHSTLDDRSGIEIEDAEPCINCFVGFMLKEGRFDNNCDYIVFSLEQSNKVDSLEVGVPTYCVSIIKSDIKVMKEVEV